MGCIDPSRNLGWVSSLVFIWIFFFLTVPAQTYRPRWHWDREKRSAGLRMPALQKAPQNPEPPKPSLAVWAQPDRWHCTDKAKKIFANIHFLGAHILPSTNSPPQKASGWRSASPKLRASLAPQNCTSWLQQTPECHGYNTSNNSFTLVT